MSLHQEGIQFIRNLRQLPPMVTVRIAPFSWYNRTQSVLTTVGNVPEGVQYGEHYLFLMDAIRALGKSQIVPQAIAERQFNK